LQFYVIVYATLNKLLAVFFINNICGFVKEFVKTSQIAVEFLRFSVFQNGGWPPSWILIEVKNGVTVRCGPFMSTIVPNFVTVRQPTAEFLRFVEKYINGDVRHFEFVFGNSGQPTKFSYTDQKSHRKFGVNGTFTFEDIVILKFCKFGLKRLFRPPNLRFWGVLNITFYC